LSVHVYIYTQTEDSHATPAVT